MSKGDTFENDLLKLIFNGTAIANIADNAASAPLASLYVAAHTADPGEGGTMATNECTYTGYNAGARPSVLRTSGGWTVTGNSVSPVAAISWGACTAGTNTITHMSVGVAASGAAKILYKGTVTPNISVSAGVTPQLTTATTITED